MDPYLAYSGSKSNKISQNEAIFERQTIDELLKTDSTPSPYSYSGVKARFGVRDYLDKPEEDIKPENNSKNDKI